MEGMLSCDRTEVVGKNLAPVEWSENGRKGTAIALEQRVYRSALIDRCQNFNDVLATALADKEVLKRLGNRRVELSDIGRG